MRRMRISRRLYRLVACLLVFLVGTWLTSGWYWVSIKVASDIRVEIGEGTLSADWGYIPAYTREQMLVVRTTYWNLLWLPGCISENGNGWLRFPLWIPVLGGGCVLLLTSPHRWVIGYCPKCDYDLFGLASGRCPECGTVIDSTNVSNKG